MLERTMKQILSRKVSAWLETVTDEDVKTNFNDYRGTL
jgi:hypothetical protein